MRLSLRQNISCGERGNGAVEMLLFTPLALFFLFVITDAGFMLTERAAVVDAVRTGLNSEGVSLETGAGGVEQTGVQLSRETIEKLTEDVKQEIADNISRVKSSVASAGSSPFAVEVSAVVVGIDPETGRLTGVSDFAYASSRYPSLGLEDPTVIVRGYPYQGKTSYIANELASAGTIPSNVAVPLGLTYSAANPQSAAVKYLPYSLLLYAEARTVTNGVNQNFVQAMLGRFYAVQVQELQLVRSQL